MKVNQVRKKFKTIGIIGGMGPGATVNLYQEIISNTPAITDQDHLPVLIYSLPQIPSRAEAILEDKESPLPYLVHAAKQLKKSGAEIFIMPCNTAHYFQKDIEEKAGIKIISIIKKTLDQIKSDYPKAKKIGLLATSAVLKTKIYQNNSKFKVILPDTNIQEECVTKAIFGENGIKQGNTGAYPKKLLKIAINNLIEKGADIIIMGCTEIPLVLKPEDSKVPLLNPTSVIARAAIKEAIQ